MEHKTLDSTARRRRQAHLSANELAVRQIPLRAIFNLEILARCNGRLLMAAEVMGISASALSTQMTRLEAALGADVITAAKSDRRTFELTENGKMLVAALRGAWPALETLASSLDHVTGSTPAEMRRRSRRQGGSLNRSAKHFPPMPTTDPDGS